MDGQLRQGPGLRVLKDEFRLVGKRYTFSRSVVLCIEIQMRLHGYFIDFGSSIYRD
jgi:hypothetical protein